MTAAAPLPPLGGPREGEEGDVELLLPLGPRHDGGDPVKRRWLRAVIAACLAAACCALAAAWTRTAPNGAQRPSVGARANPSGLVLLAESCKSTFDVGEDCGHDGITQEECEGQGCCYDETNAIWCWRPRPPEGDGGPGDDPSSQQGECQPGGSLKDCGDVGITREQCEAKGCCYDESAALWCFEKSSSGGGGGDAGGTTEPPSEPNADEAQGTCNKHDAAENCGDEGITEAQCKAKGCCYDEGAQFWCYKKPAAQAPTPSTPAPSKDEQPIATATEDAKVADGSANGSKSGKSASLFCFAILASAAEEKLMKIQEDTSTGIFACDEWGKFTSNSSAGHEGEPALPPWTLTDTFIAAWKLLKEDGRYTTHDYVVKLDVDAVFFPDRLRTWLGSNEPPGKSVYIRSCVDSPNGLQGALEVFSTQAVSKYLDDIDKCRDELDYSRWGEEVFTQQCMDRNSVIAWNFEDLLCDEECDCKPDPCTFGKIAYHPIKGADAYEKCVADSRGR